MNIWTWILILMALPASTSQSPYQPKEVTLFTQSLTWNEAYAYCENIGQSLLSLDQESYNTAVEFMMGKGPLYQQAVQTFWIGLHVPDVQDPLSKRWTSTCQTYTFSKWAPSEPKDQLCAYASVDMSSGETEFYWTMDDCFSNKRPFVCERKMDQCFYEAYEFKQSGTEKSTLFEIVNEDICKTKCLTYTNAVSGKPCWAFNFRMASGICRMLVTWDQFECDKNKQYSQYHTLFIKRCVRAQLGIPDQNGSGGPKLDNIRVPISNCSNFSSSSERTTFDNAMTTADITLATETNSPSSVSHSSVSVYPVISTDYIKDIPSEEPTVEESTTQVNKQQETTNTENANSCVCNCTSKSTSDLFISMKAILESIRVDKHKTSIAVRKRYSASDDRTSSKGMGCFAIAFLTIMAVAIVLGDFDKLYKYIKKKRHIMRPMNVRRIIVKR